MGVSISIKSFIVVIISLFCLVLGIIFIMKLMVVGDNVLESDELALPKPKVLGEVIPESSQKGTLFLIKAISINNEFQNLNLEIRGNGYSKIVSVYDDGNHYDGGSGDGVYGGFFDSGEVEYGGYELISEGEVISLFKIYQPNCEPLFGDGDDDKINFAILPFNYEDYSEFKKDAIDILNCEDCLLNIEPFKSNKDKFSFSIVNVSQDLGCEVGCRGIDTLVCCDTKIVFEEASQCHYDSIFILVDSEELCGSASSYAKVCSKDDFSGLALVHELGHSFADLADEYVYEDFYGGYDVGIVDNINCDSGGCGKWSDITSECISGCTYSDLYRSSENSIMRDYVASFNDVCKNHIEKLIENYTLNEREIEKSLPMKKSYFVNLEYNEGDLSIENVFLKPIKANLNLRKSDYSVEIINFNGDKIFQKSIYVPNKEFSLPNSFGKIIENNNFDFSVVLPYSNDAERLLIYNQGDLVDSVSLESFSDRCGDGVCDSNENHINCLKDCGIEDGFCEESECDPDCESQKNCVIYGNVRFGLGWFFLGGGFLLVLIVFLRVIRKKGV